jgi:glutamate---cysteine ligase / carboxylate-amine ligase
MDSHLSTDGRMSHVERSTGERPAGAGPSRVPVAGCVDRAATQWQPGGEFTVGAEDELLLVDGLGDLVGARASSVIADWKRQAPAGAIGGEIFVDEVELRTPACADAEELAASLRALRRTLASGGAFAMGVGVHPTAGLGQALIAGSSRYDRIGMEFGGLLRTPTAAFQVHVGLPDRGSVLLAYRGLRNRLSLFRALAAGSPYWHGSDSGQASSRAALIRSYPRTTTPPPLSSWDEYVEKIESLMSIEEVPDYTYVCWELRPHPRLGTVELRVMDAQHSVARAAGLAALVQGVARHAVEVPDPSDLPDDAVLANDFRASRYGMEASILDPDGSRRPLRDVAERAVDEACKVLAPDGLDGPLEIVRSMLASAPEYVRQRDLCQRQGMSSLLADLIARTGALDS